MSVQRAVEVGFVCNCRGLQERCPLPFCARGLRVPEITSVASAIPTADMCLAFISCLPQITGLGFSVKSTCGFVAEEFARFAV